MAAYLAKRVALALVTLLILSVIVFIAGQTLPGDPGRAVRAVDASLPARGQQGGSGGRGLYANGRSSHARVAIAAERALEASRAVPVGTS